MAAIDYFGNIIRVTAVGTCDYQNLEIDCAYIWSADTSANLIAVDVNSGTAAEVLRFSTNVAQGYWQPLHLEGKFGRLGFTAVTACTAWIVKR